jgi:hypothetical protein
MDAWTVRSDGLGVGDGSLEGYRGMQLGGYVAQALEGARIRSAWS